MIIEFADILKAYGKPIRGVIHIGAHYGQEYDSYVKHGVKKMIFFEPLEDNYRKLLWKVGEDPNVETFKMALGNEVGAKKMYVESANKGMSSSVLAPGTHLKMYPHIVFNKREVVHMEKLDNVEFDRGLYDMINIDVQGYELEVFKGARKTLESINLVYTEVNTEEVYINCALRSEIDDYLSEWGFVSTLEGFPYDNAWGDVLYIKK